MKFPRVRRPGDLVLRQGRPGREKPLHPQTCPSQAPGETAGTNYISKEERHINRAPFLRDAVKKQKSWEGPQRCVSPQRLTSEANLERICSDPQGRAVTSATQMQA